MLELRRNLVPAIACGFLAAVVAPAAAQEGPARASVALAKEWKVQPAQGPDTAPKDEDWGRSASGSWKPFVGVNREGASWRSADPRKINSLWYRQDFEAPADWKGKRVVADFRRIEGDAIVFLNGQRIGELLRPGGEVDLTDAVRFGATNSLLVYLTRDYTGISRGYEQDLLRYLVRTREKIPMPEWGLGISAPVTITARPLTAITDIFAIPSWRGKKLAIETSILSAREASGLRIVADVFGEDGTPALSVRGPEFAVGQGNSTQSVEAPWKDPIPWELEKPYLYTVRAKLVEGEKTIDEFPPVTFGFREIWTEGNKILMNGHPSRWRLTEIYGADKNGLSVYRLLGFNVGQIQPHQELWWHGKWAAETPVLNEELLNEMDRTGMGVTLPAPSVSYLRENFNKPGVAEAYARETDWFLKKYRNHPSVLAWAVAMNSYVPQSAIVPDNLGVRETNPKSQGKVINEAAGIVRRSDPTRLVFAHADGNVADIATANTYLNFVPLQEREEWPKAWAEKGNMPYQAVEFGAPYPANFWKGKQFLLTEYLAMYFGDRAYAGEGEAGPRKAIADGLLNKGGHGAWSKVDLSAYPAYWDLIGLFAKNTNRAWRTWGINGGWLYFNIGQRFGHPSRTKDVNSYEELNYNFLKEPLAEKPAWADRNWDIFKQANQPLLVYLAGDPIHTDKTHAFYVGETVKKQIAAVWDGSEPTRVEAEWALKRGGEVLASGKEALDLQAGDIRFAPFSFQLPPKVEGRTDLVLELAVKQDGKTVEGDQFDLQVFPRPAPMAIKARVALFDPLGKSASELQKLGVDPKPWKPGDGFGEVDILVIGREVIKPGDPLPYRSEDIRDGLRVLFLEQHPQTWRSLGFETIETMPRYVFARETSLLAWLEPRDLLNWRGSPDLLPEGEQVVSSDAPHAPKWTNRHAVASVALKTPHAVGFTPLIETEFDLAYSPLLEWRDGKGAIWFSSLDFTGRVGVDPAATLLARNLIGLVGSSPLRATVPVYFEGGDGAWLARLGVAPKPGLPADGEKDALVIVGGEVSPETGDKIRAFAKAGGTVLRLGLSDKALQSLGFAAARHEIYRAVAGEGGGLLRGIGPNLLRWQDALEIAAFDPAAQPAGARVFAGGILLENKVGSGRQIFLQATPSLLEGRYQNDPDKREAIQLSVLRLNRLLSQVLTNLGATPSPEIARRLAVSRKAPAISTLGSWRVLGPFQTDKTKGYQILGDKFPGEWDALNGAENPNTVYRLPDDSTRDWRRTVDANRDGFVDLGALLDGPKSGRVAYVTRSIDSDKDREVTFHIGVDYWLQFWVNRQSVLKVDETHGSPVPDAFKVTVPLKQGKNILTLKVGSGSNGFGFWCIMKSDEAGSSEAKEIDPPLYIPPFRTFDPYQFTYW